MLSVLLRSLTQAGRVLRNFITRPIFMIRSKLYYMTNLGRYLSRLPSLFTALPKAVAKKPEKRADYASVGKVFMAKKFIAIIAIVVIVVPILFYIFIWPLIQPLWFTVSYTVGDNKYATYSGRVKIYFDDDREQLMFHGRLLDGKYSERGTLWHETSFMKYTGTFTEGLYDEFGTVYGADGLMLYEGSFAMGLYQGTGTLYSEGSGDKLYEGEFDKGLYSGQGILYYPDGSRLYEGLFLLGLYHGPGELYYENGRLEYKGNFDMGLYSGWGELYNENGVLIYEGEFLRGEKSGFGTEYDDEGNIVYKGGFADGKYDGQGTLYDEEGNIIYEGGFAGGEFDGQGTLYDKEGNIIYEGGFAGGQFDGVGKLAMEDGYAFEGAFSGGAADGMGKLTLDGITVYVGDFAGGLAQGSGTFVDRASGVTFTGQFEDGMIAPGPLFAMDVASIYAAFETGMTEFQSDTEFFLYNSVLGYTLRFEYASEDNPAKLVAIYMSPNAKLPTAGGAAAMAASASKGSGNEQPAPDAKRPTGRILSMTGVSLPDNAVAFSEVKGTVLATIWKTASGSIVLYVFEPVPIDYVPPAAKPETPNVTADKEYYELFGLEELIP